MPTQKITKEILDQRSAMFDLVAKQLTVIATNYFKMNDIKIKKTFNPYFTNRSRIKISGSDKVLKWVDNILEYWRYYPKKGFDRQGKYCLYKIYYLDEFLILYERAISS